MRDLKHFERIRFEDISFSDDHGDMLFEGASIDFPVGEIVRVKGGSGSGKSLLLKILAGLVQPTKGHVYFNEVAIDDLTFEEFIPYRLNIGYSFEFGGLIHNKTLRQNLTLPLEYHPDFDLAGGMERIDYLIKTFELEKYQHKRPSDVPGSFRKLTVVLRAFVMHPDLLVLDDPSTGLTEVLKKKVTDLIYAELESGHAKHVFIVSKDQRFMDNFEVNTIEIKERKLVFDKIIEKGKAS